MLRKTVGIILILGMLSTLILPFIFQL